LSFDSLTLLLTASGLAARSTARRRSTTEAVENFV
jgi:hypothetical protein